jgi:hypothetical protein
MKPNNNQDKYCNHHLLYGRKCLTCEREKESAINMPAEPLKIGFPLNEKSAENDKYATLSIDGYEARFAMTGMEFIIGALKKGLNRELISAFVVVDAIQAFEKLHARMWEICDAEDKAKSINGGENV